MQAAADGNAIGVAEAAMRARPAVSPLLQPLLRSALEQPRALALRGNAQTLDYADLFGSIERIAAGLHALGVASGDIVALGAEREPETVMLMLGVLRAGGVCMPLDMSLPAARLRIMLDDARPRLLVAPEESRIGWPRHLPRCERGELEARGVNAPSAPAAGAEAAYLLFTSGSSGRPKGVLMRSAALAALIGWHMAHPRLAAAARTLQYMPYGFDVAFHEILSTFAAGGTLVIAGDAERRDPWALLALLVRERVERAFLPAAALQALAEAIAAGADAPPALLDVITGGEQLRVTPAIRALFAAMPGSVLHNHYGPTETQTVITHELHGDPAGWPELPPIGKPMPHVRVRVVAPSLDTLAPGTEGELLLGGDCLSAGYLHRERLTAERFIEHGGARWYRTGDLVREGEDGTLAFLGRLDGQIMFDGYRIEPAEIEVVLSRHPAVAEAAVVVAPSAQGKRLVAHVVTRAAHSGGAVFTATLLEHCRGHLPPWMVPQRFVVHAALPQTATGKIDRRALACEEQEEHLPWYAHASLQQQLRALWAQLLDLAELDVDANLFDTGARSLTVVRALTELRRHGVRGLSAAQVYEHPTVAGQAALLTAAPESTFAADAARLRGECQRGAFARFASSREGAR